MGRVAVGLTFVVFLGASDVVPFKKKGSEGAFIVSHFRGIRRKIG
jgi:hypothetical protein